MADTKFTPGPWGRCFHLESLENDASCPCGYRGSIWGSDGERVVCEMGSTADPGEEALAPARYDRPTEFANAALIAAAPELYAELESLAKRFRNALIHTGTDPEFADDAIEDARVALAKARGDQ